MTVALSLQMLKELIQPSQRPPRTCEGCGHPFVCGASLKGCWCFGLKLDEPVRTDLRARYRDCLCRACLEAAQAQAESPHEAKA